MPKKPDPKIRAAVKEAMGHFQNERYAEVVALTDEVLEAVPKNYNARLLGAKARFSTGDFSGSDSLYQSLCQDELEQGGDELRLDALAGLDELYSSDSSRAWALEDSGRFGSELHTRSLKAMVASLTRSKTLRKLKGCVLRLAQVFAHHKDVAGAHRELMAAAQLFCGGGGGGGGGFAALAGLPAPKRQSVFELVYSDVLLVRAFAFGNTDQDGPVEATAAMLRNNITVAEDNAQPLMEVFQELGTAIGALNSAVDDLPTEQKAQYCDALAIVTAGLRVNCQLAAATNGREAVSKALCSFLEWCRFAYERAGAIADACGTDLAIVAFQSIVNHTLLISQIAAYAMSAPVLAAAAWLDTATQEKLATASIQLGSKLSANTSTTPLRLRGAESAILFFDIIRSAGQQTASATPPPPAAAAVTSWLLALRSSSSLGWVVDDSLCFPVHYAVYAHHDLRAGRVRSANAFAARALVQLEHWAKAFGLRPQNSGAAPLLDIAISSATSPALLASPAWLLYTRALCEIRNACCQSVTAATPEAQGDGGSVKGRQAQLLAAEQSLRHLFLLRSASSPNCTEKECWRVSDAGATTQLRLGCAHGILDAQYETVRLSQRFPGLLLDGGSSATQLSDLQLWALKMFGACEKDDSELMTLEALDMDAIDVSVDPDGRVHSLLGWVALRRGAWSTSVALLRRALELHGAMESPKATGQDPTLTAVSLTRLAHAQWELDKASNSDLRADKTRSFPLWLRAVQCDGTGPAAADAFAGLGMFYSLDVPPAEKQADVIRSRGCFEKALQLDPLALDSAAGRAYVCLLFPDQAGSQHASMTMATTAAGAFQVEQAASVARLQAFLETVVLAHKNAAAWAWHGLGKVYLHQFHNRVRARSPHLHDNSAFLTAAAADAEDGGAQAAAEIGESLLLRSIKSFQSALRVDTKAWGVWACLGAAYLEHGRLTAAQKALARALELCPSTVDQADSHSSVGSAHLRERYGHVLFLLQELDAAIESFRASLAAAPHYVLALVGVAQCHLHRGRNYRAGGRDTAAAREFLIADDALRRASHIVFAPRHANEDGVDAAGEAPSDLEYFTEGHDVATSATEPTGLVIAKIHGDICCAAADLPCHAFRFRQFSSLSGSSNEVGPSLSWTSQESNREFQEAFVRRGRTYLGFVERAVSAASEAPSPTSNQEGHHPVNAAARQKLRVVKSVRNAAACYDVGRLEIQLSRLGHRQFATQSSSASESRGTASWTSTADLPCTAPHGGHSSVEACTAFKRALRHSPYDPLLWNGLGVAESDGPLRQHCLVHALELARQQAAQDPTSTSSSSTSSSTASDGSGGMTQQQRSDATYWTNLAMLYLTAIPAVAPQAASGVSSPTEERSEWSRRLAKHSKLAGEVLGISQCLNAANAVLWIGRAMASYRLLSASRAHTQGVVNGENKVLTESTLRHRIAEAFECAVEVPPPPRTPATALLGVGFWALREHVSGAKKGENSRATALRSVADVVASLQRAHQLNPRDARAVVLLALANELLGDVPGALRHYAAASEILKSGSASSADDEGAGTLLATAVSNATRRCEEYVRSSALHATLRAADAVKQVAALSDARRAENALRRGHAEDALAMSALTLLLHPESTHAQSVQSLAAEVAASPAWWVNGNDVVSAGVNQSPAQQILKICIAHAQSKGKAVVETISEIESLCSGDAVPPASTAAILARVVQATLASQISDSERRDGLKPTDFLRTALSHCSEMLEESSSATSTAKSEARALLPLINARLSLCSLYKFQTAEDPKVKKKALERACRSAEMALTAAETGAVDRRSRSALSFLFAAIGTAMGTAPGAGKKDVSRLSTIQDQLRLEVAQLETAGTCEQRLRHTRELAAVVSKALAAQ